MVPVLVLGALSLWMRAAFPVHAIVYANYDDAWFIKEARFLGTGHWLGPYDSMTLIKGMFYPWFIAGSVIASIPLLTLEHAIYLAVCAGVTRLLTRPMGAAAASILFGLLAFNPVLWNSELNRVIREGLYISLSLACVGLAVATTFPVRAGRGRFGLCIALGLVGGAFWLTREEGVWLLPALGLVFASGFILPDASGTPLRSRAVRVASSWAVSAAVALSMVLGVCATNWVKYRVFLTTEFQGGAFPRAYGALTRITPEQWHPYVVFPADAQARAYTVSLAAAELAPVLAGPRGRAWATTGCSQTKTEPCPGVLSGWFMWALRDAAATAGHHTTAREAQRYYNRLATEINEACDSGRLPCGPPNAGFVPPFRWEYLDRTARSAMRLATLMAKVGPDGIGSLPSQGRPYDLAAFADVVGPIAPVSEVPVFVNGWVADMGTPPQLRVVQGSGQPTNIQLSTEPVTDSANGWPGWSMVRFQLSTTCAENCSLEAIGATGQVISRAMSSLAPDTNNPDVGPALHIDSVDAHSPLSASMHLRAIRVTVARVISTLYRSLAPPALIIAALGVSACFLPFWRRILPSRQVAFAGACFAAVLSRLLLLAYLDATSIPSVNDLYASPASPFVIGFTVVGCFMGWSLLQHSNGQVGRPADIDGSL